MRSCAVRSFPAPAERAGAHELGLAAQTDLRHRHRTLPELRRFEETACQRKPTAPLALSSTERRDLRAAPDPAIQDRNSYSTQLRLTGSARWRYFSAQKKGGLKILSMARSAE